MENLSLNLAATMEGFIQEKVDFSKYETSFRRFIEHELLDKKVSGWLSAR